MLNLCGAARRIHWGTVLLSAVTVLSLAGCSGGGGSADRPETGSVGILITDGPTDAFDEVNVTVTSIELVSAQRSVSVFSGSERFDLLTLESFSDLLVVSDDVPADSYDSVRIRLADLELVTRDAAGGILEAVRPALPNDGVVDIDPGEPFFVAPGSTLLVEIDIDVDKSLELLDNGEYRFRPVLSIDVDQFRSNRKLARFDGEIRAIDPFAQRFELCDTGVLFDIDDDSDSDSDRDGLGNEDGCIAVNVFSDTGLFDPDGDPASVENLAVGDLVTVIGHAVAVPDDDADSDSAGDSDSDSDNAFDEDEIELDAAVVEIGPPGTFVRLRGESRSAVDPSTDIFSFEIGEQQGFTQDAVVSALIQNGTRIFSRQGGALDVSAIQDGVPAHVDGVLLLSDVEPDLLKTALIVLDVDLTIADKFSGEILTVDASQRSLVMATNVGDRCVEVPPDTEIIRVENSADGTSSARIALADLVSGQRIDVYGQLDISGCIVAETVVAFVD